MPASAQDILEGLQEKDPTRFHKNSVFSCELPITLKEGVISLVYQAPHRWAGSGNKGHAKIIVEFYDEQGRFCLNSYHIIPDHERNSIKILDPAAGCHSSDGICQSREDVEAVYTGPESERNKIPYYASLTASSWRRSLKKINKMDKAIRDEFEGQKDLEADDPDLIKYSKAGRGSVYTRMRYGSNSDNCITWCIRQLKQAGIHIDAGFFSSAYTKPQKGVDPSVGRVVVPAGAAVAGGAAGLFAAGAGAGAKPALAIGGGAAVVAGGLAYNRGNNHDAAVSHGAVSDDSLCLIL